MREFELYTRILSPAFLADDPTCMEEVKAGHKVTLITQKIDDYRLYRFDIDSSDADFLCFFNKNHSDNSSVRVPKNLRKFCDYVLLAQKKDKLFIFIIELKSGSREGAKVQLMATELFMDYIKATAERIKGANGYDQFDAANIKTKKVVCGPHKTGSNPFKDKNPDDPLHLCNNEFRISLVIRQIFNC